MEALASVLLLAAIVQKVLERIRSRWPAIDGDIVTMAAVAVGTAISYFGDLNAAADLVGASLPLWLDHVVTGLAIGAGAGVIAELTNRVQ